jgi:hypothetical protein
MAEGKAITTKLLRSAIQVFLYSACSSFPTLEFSMRKWKWRTLNLIAAGCYSRLKAQRMKESRSASKCCR